MTIPEAQTNIDTYNALARERAVIIQAQSVDLAKTVSLFELRIIGLTSSSVPITAILDLSQVAASIMSVLSTRKTAIEAAMSSIESQF